MRALATLLAVAAATACSPETPAGGDSSVDAARPRLEALRSLCEDGLVTPQVCAEKQRQILGLRGLPGATAEGPAAAGRRPDRASAQERPPDPPLPDPGPAFHGSSGVTFTLPEGWTPVARTAIVRARRDLREALPPDAAADDRLAALLGAATTPAAAYSRPGATLQVHESSRPRAASRALLERVCGRIGQAGEAGGGTRCGVISAGGQPALVVEQVLPDRAVLLRATTGSDRGFVSLALTTSQEAANEGRADLRAALASLAWEAPQDPTTVRSVAEGRP